VTESLEALDIEVDYMGVPLTDLLKSEEALLGVLQRQQHGKVCLGVGR